MEKRTLSQYAWIVIALIILLILSVLALSLNDSLSAAFVNGINDFSLRMKVFMPLDYKNVVQEGEWEYKIVGYTPTDSDEFTDADKSDGLVPTVQLTKYTGGSHRQIIIPNIYIDEEGNKYIVAGVGGMDETSDTYNEENARVFGEASNKVKNIIVSQGVAIQTGAFNSLERLETVLIADNCTLIGDYAFAGCPNLQNIRCGKNNQFIGKYAFANCINLDNVHFGDELYEIGDYAFYNCSKYTPINGFPNTLYKIGNSAFLNCETLETLNLEKTSLVSIGNNAFYDCANITGTIYLPDSLEYIGANAFENCKSISGQLIIPENLKVLGDSCFKNINFSKVDFSKNRKLEIIGNQAFLNCVETHFNIVLPSTIKYIGESAFYQCMDTTNLVLPEGLLFIGSNAFLGLGRIAMENHTIIIPSTCEHLGGSFTYNYIDGSVTINAGSDIIIFSNNMDAELLVSDLNPNFTVSENQIISK